ncbi:hypothetical protein V6N13_138271 [Hibiscus sabdariffa]|uniref:Uncharacterized protein n=1 Tax=Hibiscus sabdariffa TaxID=183260 RepID=A0ABR2QCX2_9ROSI
MAAFTAELDFRDPPSVAGEVVCLIAYARKWVLDILLNGLQQKAESGDPVEVLVHFRHAILCLLVLMCFSDKLNEEQIKEIGSIQRRVLTAFRRFRLVNFWPRVTKVLLLKQCDQWF